MTQLLRTADETAKFLVHDDSEVRDWALDSLESSFPDQAPGYLVEALGKLPTDQISQALRIIGKYGDPTVHGPPLREYLQGMVDEPEWAYVAAALADMGDAQAAPLVLQQQEQRTVPYNTTEMIFLQSALASFDTEETLAELRQMTVNMLEGGRYIPICLREYLKKAPVQELPGIVNMYLQSHAEAESIWDQDPLAGAADVARPAEDMLDSVETGDIDGVVDIAGIWFGNPLEFPDRAIEQLRARMTPPFRKLPNACLQALEELLDHRGDTPDAWEEAWRQGERTRGYRWRVLFARIVFKAMAECQFLTDPQACAALAMLFQLFRDGDDERRLAEAENREEELITILCEDRDQVLPEIVDAVAPIAEKYLPQLISALHPTTIHWGNDRILDVVEKVARHRPATVLPFVPDIIAMLNEESGDMTLEKATAVLRTIGPPVIPMVADALPQADSSGEIYLTGVLGDIPVQESAQSIMDHYDDPGRAEEWAYSALYSLADPESIPYLVSAFTHNTVMDACEALYVTCIVNGEENPYRELCEKRIADQQERLEALRETWTRPDPQPVDFGPLPAGGSHSTNSQKKKKKKKKKKMAQKSRKKNRRKKKKK